VKILFVVYYLRKHIPFLVSKEDGYTIPKGSIFKTSFKNELSGTQ